MKIKIFTVSQLWDNFANKGHTRSIKAKKNILAAFIIKGCSMFIGLLLVPLTINYLNPSRYGIWITLSSIVGWFEFFDIGFGNGLRNKFAENIAKGHHKVARIYVSTTYAILIILMVIALILFFFINPLINWTKILNSPPNMAHELSLLALIVFVFFCIKFVLQLLSTVMTANQEPAKASLLNLFGSIFSLVIILILVKTTSSNLVYLGSALSITPVIILAASSIWFYKNEYKAYAPAIRFVNFKYVRNLMSLGIKFFIIQIAAVILFQTDNIVITQLFGPEEVTIFNIAFKFFSIFIMSFTIIVTPLWSAFTEAYANDDFGWIKGTLLKMKIIWVFLMVFTITALFMSPTIFKWWVGPNINIPFSLSIAMTVYIIAYGWQTIHVYFLNGIGKIRLQLYLVVVSGLINIPIAIFFGKRIGLAGITLSNTILFIILGILFSIQVKKIINRNAKGIWNK